MDLLGDECSQEKVVERRGEVSVLPACFFKLCTNLLILIKELTKWRHQTQNGGRMKLFPELPGITWNDIIGGYLKWLNARNSVDRRTRKIFPLTLVKGWALSRIAVSTLLTPLGSMMLAAWFEIDRSKSTRGISFLSEMIRCSWKRIQSYWIEISKTH